MMEYSLFLENEQHTEELAYHLAPCLVPVTLILTFSGEIGTGKTTFIRFLLQALGIKEAIKSPSFSLIESYLGSRMIHHLDLYRIQVEEELEYIGFRDYFKEKALFCIEWPERLSDTFIVVDLHFDFSYQDNGRWVLLKAKTKKGEKVLSCLINKK